MIWTLESFGMELMKRGVARMHMTHEEHSFRLVAWCNDGSDAVAVDMELNDAATKLLASLDAAIGAKMLGAGRPAAGGRA